MSRRTRVSTGVPGLDEQLGGGLLPGTLTLVIGATGIGKTQLGLQFAEAGNRDEGRPGVIFDMTARGDSQNHREYVERMFDWSLQSTSPDDLRDASRVLRTDEPLGQYLRVFDQQGRRINRRDIEEEMWHQWQSQVNRNLAATIAYLYGGFVRGVRRVLVDGIEPVDDPGDSVQLQLFEYIYHQILKKEHDWVARDLFRQDFRSHAPWVDRHAYNPGSISCMMLYTSHETMLEDMIARPLSEGDLLSAANTIVYMGKLRNGNSIGRAIHIAKHRGSACSDEILPFRISQSGVTLID